VSELELDGLLGEWAADARLTAREVGDVRASVLATRPAGLDPAWWSGLMGQVNAAVIQAVALPPSARSALSFRWTPGVVSRR
jgi:hypothetical protein